MDDRTRLQQEQVRIFHVPCAFNPRGVSKETCQRTTIVYQRNQQGCCKSACKSLARLCIACLTDNGGEPNAVAHAKTGLCEWHTTHGRDAKRRRASVASLPMSRASSQPRPKDGGRNRLDVMREVAQKRAAAQATSAAVSKPNVSAKPRLPAGTPPVQTVAQVPIPSKDDTVSPDRWKPLFGRVQKAMGNAEYVKVDPARIRPMPNQPREWFDQHALLELSQSIVEVGQFQPGIIRKVEAADGIEYEILDGERRWRAIILGKVPEYKAMLVEIDDEAAPFVIASIANFNRADHTHMELSNAIERLHNGLGMPIPVVAKLYTMTEHWAYQLHGLQKLHPRFRNLIDPRLQKNKRLPITAAIQVSKLEQSVQVQLVDTFRAGGVTLKGLRKKAVDIAQQTGTYIRQREADQPARKLKPIGKLPIAVVRTLTDLHALLDEKGMAALLRNNPEAASQALAVLDRASELLNKCRHALTNTQPAEK